VTRAGARSIWANRRRSASCDTRGHGRHRVGAAVHGGGRTPPARATLSPLPGDGVREKRGISLVLLTLLSVVPAAVAVNCGVSGRRPSSMQVEPRPQRYPVWLIWDSRVVMGQVECNSLFLQAFHEGRDRCSIFGKSLLISSAYVPSIMCKTPESNKSLAAKENGRVGALDRLGV
jgi:hypothetical protein